MWSIQNPLLYCQARPRRQNFGHLSDLGYIVRLFILLPTIRCKKCTRARGNLYLQNILNITITPVNSIYFNKFDVKSFLLFNRLLMIFLNPFFEFFLNANDFFKASYNFHLFKKRLTKRIHVTIIQPFYGKIVY